MDNAFLAPGTGHHERPATGRRITRQWRGQLVKTGPWLQRTALLFLLGCTGTLALAACPAHTEGFTCKEYESPPRHASTPAGRYVMYFYIETCPHCQDARPKVDAWRKTLPADVTYVEHVAKWRDRDGPAFAYRIESVPSFVVDGKYLVAIDSWEPEHTDAAIALVSELAGIRPAD